MTKYWSASRRARLSGDRGSILATMAISIAFSALILVLIANALAASNKTRASKEFTLAGQRSDTGMSEALSTLNGGSTTLPTAAAPVSSVGTAATGYWKWWVIPSTGQPAGLIGKIDSRGSYGMTQRTTDASLYSMQLTSVTLPDGTRDFQVSPGSAFSHAVFGNNIRLTAGSGVTPASMVTGVIGGAGGAVSLGGTSGAYAGATGGLVFYGSGNGSLTPSSAASTTSPMSLNFDGNATSALYASSGGCNGTSPAWQASTSGLARDAAGNVLLPVSNTLQCRSSLVFDVPVKITGTGVWNFLLPTNAAVSINANITADPTASLAIYGGSKTNFGGTAGVRSIANTYLFSPGGSCAADSGNVTIDYTGSIACQAVRVIGKVTWKAVTTDSAGSTATIDPRLSPTRVWWTASSVNAGSNIATGG